MRTELAEEIGKQSTMFCFDNKRLKQDVLRALCKSLGTGQEFIGHDGRIYLLVAAADQSVESEVFIEVRVSCDDVQQVVSKYAILLDQISR